MPPFFIGTAMDIPSGISCKQIAKAKPIPNLVEASKPEPIASPSGKLCIASPILTIIPVFNKLLALNSLFWLNFLLTNKSQNIIAIIPKIIPIITVIIFAIPNASGTKSKHIIDIIKPDAKDSIKLKNLFDTFLKKHPIIPPKVVPKVPKNKPNSVVFIISINPPLLDFIINNRFLFFFSHLDHFFFPNDASLLPWAHISLQ